MIYRIRYEDEGQTLRVQGPDKRRLLLRRSSSGKYDGYAGHHFIEKLDPEDGPTVYHTDQNAVSAAFRFDAAATAHEDRHGCKNAFRCPLAAHDFEMYDDIGASRDVSDRTNAFRTSSDQPGVHPHAA